MTGLEELGSHTPGPWFPVHDHNEAGNAWRVRADGGLLVADLEESDMTLLTDAFNARLIASAPDLLEVLKATRERVQTWPLDDHHTCMCGSPLEGHTMWSGHSPVSQAENAISIIVEEIDSAIAKATTASAVGMSEANAPKATGDA